MDINQIIEAIKALTELHKAISDYTTNEECKIIKDKILELVKKL